MFLIAADALTSLLTLLMFTVGDEPVLDIPSPHLACNQGTDMAAALVADAEAGDGDKLKLNAWSCKYHILFSSFYAQFLTVPLPFADHIGPVTVYMTDWLVTYSYITLKGHENQRLTLLYP